jgi:hypothetical protein
MVLYRQIVQSSVCLPYLMRSGPRSRLSPGSAGGWFSVHPALDHPFSGARATPLRAKCGAEAVDSRYTAML